jgi:hypothetical protein
MLTHFRHLFDGLSAQQAHFNNHARGLILEHRFFLSAEGAFHLRRMLNCITAIRMTECTVCSRQQSGHRFSLQLD